jgi:hypothetical protein
MANWVYFKVKLKSNTTQEELQQAIELTEAFDYDMPTINLDKKTGYWREPWGIPCFVHLMAFLDIDLEIMITDYEGMYEGNIYHKNTKLDKWETDMLKIGQPDFNAFICNILNDNALRLKHADKICKLIKEEITL